MGAEFWGMGGYAAYVWGSFGAAVLTVVWNVMAPRWQRRRVLQQLVEQEGTEPDHGD